MQANMNELNRELQMKVEADMAIVQKKVEECQEEKERALRECQEAKEAQAEAELAFRETQEELQKQKEIAEKLAKELERYHNQNLKVNYFINKKVIIKCKE